MTEDRKALEAMVDSMKENKEAFMFWPSEWKEWAVENWKEMRVLCGGLWSQKETDLYCSSDCYRLRPDFKLPEPERWYYAPNSYSLNLPPNGVPLDGWVEVPADDLDYVKAQIARTDIDLKEWEYRKLVEGETVSFLSKVNALEVPNYLTAKGDDCYSFVRKAKPAGWKTLEVVKEKNGILVVDLNGKKGLGEAWLYAINRGMTPQFRFDGWSNTWKDLPFYVDTDDKPARFC